MANIKFSGFTAVTDVAGIQEIVGYNGTANVRISPVNFINSSGGPYLPLAGGTMTGNLIIPGFIFHTGDLDTYFGFSANNEFLVVAGGSNKFAADANAAYMYYQGGLKLQTTSTGITVASSAKIETTTNVDAKLILNPFSSGLGTSYQWNIDGRGSAGNYAFQISEGSTPYLNISNSAGGTGGNVGIGTTSPGVKLDVDGQIRSDDAFLLNSGATAIGSIRNQAGALDIRGDSTRDVSLGSVTSPQALFIEGSNGNVGIGTTGPGAKLEVNSGGGIHLSDDTAGRTLIIKPSLTGAIHEFTSDNTSAGYSFSNNTSELMRIASNGSLQFNAYNNSNNTGAATFLLGTDANGNVVKTTTVPSGSGGPFLPLAGGTMTGDLYLSTDADILKSGTNPFRLFTNGTLALSVSASQNATFAGEINLADNKAVLFGGGGKAFIKHDGSNFSLINDTGNITFTNRADGKDIIFESDNGSGGTTPYFKVDPASEATTFLKRAYFPDNVKAQFGNSSDLKIYHDGDHSYIQDTSGTGDLRIDTNVFRLRSANGGESMITAFEDNAVNLMFNTFTKLSTTNTGVTVTGDIQLDNSSPKLIFNNLAGGGLDPTLTADGSDFTISTSSLTALSLALDTGNATFVGRVGIGIAATSNAMLDVKGPDTDNAVLGRFFSNTGTRGSFIIRNGTSVSPTTFIGTAGGSEELSIGTNNTEALRINGSQNATFTGNIILDGDGKLLKFTPTSYDDVEIGMDSNGFVIYNTTDARYDLKISGTGNATFAGDVIIGTSGKGILLGGTSAANRLDDYEEGTWTPALGGTWTTDPTSITGTYTKVGNLVSIRLYFSGGAKDTATAGYFTGLPFTTDGPGTGSVTDSGVADRGNCLFANTDRVWLTSTGFGSGPNYVSGQYTTNQ